jgi:hypothetical protein
MSNRGVFSGLAAETWRSYETEIVACVVPGGATPTQPSLGTDGYKYGRFIDLPGGLVVAQAKFVWGTTANGASAGSGSDAYMVRLPRPANRWTAAVTDSANADLPIGTGIGRSKTTVDPMLTMPLIPTLADPFPPFAYQSGQDYYAQLFCAHSIQTGTATISGASTSVDVDHGLDITPAMSDIIVNVSGITGAPAAVRSVYVTSVDANTFRINVQVAPGGATALDFAWKIRAEPNSSESVTPLVNHGRPWAWGEGCEISVQMIYESKF